MSTVYKLSLIGLLFHLGSCQSPHSVVAATGTVVGIELGQSPTGNVTASLGYGRTELAVVPTNRDKGWDAGDTGNGAKDTTDVLMEVAVRSVFSFSGDAGIYQRLAVGPTAVKQPGAALMFAASPGQNLDGATAASISQAFQGRHGAIDSIAASASAFSSRADLARAFSAIPGTFQDYPIFDEYDQVAVGAGFESFTDFLDEDDATDEQIRAVEASLNARGLIEKARLLKLFASGNTDTQAKFNQAAGEFDYKSFDDYAREANSPVANTSRISSQLEIDHAE